MGKIAVLDYFLSEKHRSQIEDAAKRNGFTVDFLPTIDVPEDKVLDYEIMYGSPRRKQLLPMKNLKWWCASFAGMEKFCDPSLYAREDIIITNASGTFGMTISEHIIMVLLMLMRNESEYFKIVENHGWSNWKNPLPMRSIFKSNITILGTGDIGTETAKRLRGFSPACIRGVRKSHKPCGPDFDESYSFDQLDEVLPKSEILIMCLPSTKETQYFLNREKLQMLPKNCLLVNVGRGDAILKEDLKWALEEGIIAGASVDVSYPEPLPEDDFLWDTKNLLITPHVAGGVANPITKDINIQLFCDNIDRYAKGEELLHRIDITKGY